MRNRALTQEQVNDIRTNTEKSIRDFATELGVSYITVRNARKGLGAYSTTGRFGASGTDVGETDNPPFALDSTENF